MSLRRIGVLAVQGAFVEHEEKLRNLDCETVQLRSRADIDESLDGLVLPGGESSVQSKLLQELDMYQPLKSMIEEGMPVLGTCAGLILLAKEIVDGAEGTTSSTKDLSVKELCQNREMDAENKLIESKVVIGFETLPIKVMRNAYGRQLASFNALGEVAGELAENPFVKNHFVEDAFVGNHLVEESLAENGCAKAEFISEIDKIPMCFIRAPKIVALSQDVETLVELEGEPVAVSFNNQIACAFHPELTNDDRILTLFINRT